MLRRYAVYVLMSALLLVVVIVAGGRFARAGARATRDENRPSIVKFSHQKHIKDLGIECITCHPAAQTSKLSSDTLAAKHENCQTCHEDQVNNDCAYCHTTPDNIQPRPKAVRETTFSHEQHLAMKGIECTTCHQGLDETDLSSPKNMPVMATCTTCHNNAKATNTCEACHTNFVTLLPEDHKRSDFARNHRDLARLGALTTDCQTCHTEQFCQQCHQTTGLKAFGGKDLVTEPSPKTSTKDSPKQMLLQNIHDLNYRYTHGIDAKARQSDCASCHDAQTFCATCHEAGGNITQGRFKPASHMVPGFTTLGPGSGGGLHAEEARRDIESCISCHDVEGHDPTCLTCHTEGGRVR